MPSRERLLLGARLSGSWVIAGIAGDCVTVRRDGHTLAMHF